MKKTSISKKKANSDIKVTLSKDLYFVRGIAISLVVLGHVIGGRYEGIRQLYEQDILYIDWLYKFIYTFHMPIFFIASGISFKIFSSNNNSYTEFVSSKFTRLVIPLIFWSSFYFLFRCLAGVINFSFFGLIESVFFPNFIFWFFYALLFANFLSFILIKNINYPIAYYTVSILLFIISFYLKGTLKDICYFNIFYTSGIVIAPHLSKICLKLENMSDSLSWLLILLLVLIMLLVTNLLANDYSLVAKFINGIIGFCLMYMLATLNKPFYMFEFLNRFSQFIAGVFTYLGLVSMSIYLLHILFSSTTRIILVKFGLIDPLTQFILGYVISLIGPLLIHKMLYDKSKLFRYSIGEAK
ncbi:acyltransferase family protein [Nostoc sp. PA-18-2419]|uniref:acyltransferase family protein n=1 Tax=Nostoc sp. PA-18-2419 TaxID=2575443 RepID=UPI001107F2D1|nr:acyltransferase [Nostoc sp. PA-18-2419]